METSIDLTGLTEKIHRNGGTVYYEDLDGNIVAKKCRGECGLIKELYLFNKDKSKLGGRNTECRECKRNRDRLYRESKKNDPVWVERRRKSNREYYRSNRDNPEFMKKKRGQMRRWRKYNPEWAKKWRENNPDKVKEISRRHYQRHSKKYREYSKNYYHSHKYDREFQEMRRRSKQEYHKKNSEKVNERSRRWREDNYEKFREYSRMYYRKNRERKREYDKEYAQENPEKFALARQRRRARKAMLPDTLNEEQYSSILDHFDGGCALTGKKADLHMDHVVPLAVGHGGTIYGNVIPLDGDLNNNKRTQCIFDWFYENKERFNLEQRKFDELIEYLAEINGMSTTEYEEYVRWCHDNPRTLDEIKAEQDEDKDAS